MAATVAGVRPHRHHLEMAMHSAGAGIPIPRTRDDAPLSFGYGTHDCIGASLARLEGDVVYSEMLGRYPRMALAGEPVRQDTFRARAFSEIPVVLEPS